MKNSECSGFYSSEIGIIEIIASDLGVNSLRFRDFAPERTRENQHVRECIRQLDEYFKGQRKEFTLTLDLSPTDFQNKVWNQLKDTPYGQTITYADLALREGSILKARAVGMACAANPVPIIIPCHRAIGKSGRLVGFRAELWRKKWLLEHEEKHSRDFQAELFEIIPGKISSIQHPVVLYDGFCLLCERSVGFILNRDKEQKFRFSPLSSDFAKEVLDHFGLPETYNNSVLLFHNNKLYKSSSAAIKIASMLPGFWFLTGIFFLVPKFIRDFIYNFVAKRRLRWYGKRDDCYIPGENTLRRIIH